MPILSKQKNRSLSALRAFFRYREKHFRLSLVISETIRVFLYTKIFL